MSDDFQQRGGSPWGTPPGGGGDGNGSGRGPTPPDVDKIIKEFQEKIKKFLPGGSSSGGKQAILILIIFAWTASYLFRVFSGNMTFMEQRKRYREAYEKLTDEKIRENLGFKDGFFKNDEEHQIEVIKKIRKCNRY